MKLYDAGTILLLIIFVSFSIGIASDLFLSPDNPVEEIAEDIIEKETGVKVDLSPGSEEK